MAIVMAYVQASAGDNYRQFPGAPTDSRTLRIQERVESIFSSGDYARALLIYEKELAPLGDKYAQYMVGYMHLNGKGVAENPAEAFAWYRLAAERGEGPFIKARDSLRDSLEPDELEQSEQRFAQLWQRYGDRRLILDLISRDLDILRRAPSSATGLGDDGLGDDDRGYRGPRISIVSGYQGHEINEVHYRRIKERLAERLRYLPSTADAEDAGIEDPSTISRLEAEVRQELRALDLP
jgi:hypothetical protein